MHLRPSMNKRRESNRELKISISTSRQKLALHREPPRVDLLAAHTDDTRGHELLYLGANVCVLEMLLQRSRVVLGLLQDALHNGVLQDGDDLAKLAWCDDNWKRVELTSGSRWMRSMVCSSVSPSRAEYCA